MSVLIFYLEFIYTSCTTYSLYLFFRSLTQSTSYARGLVDYSLRCARWLLRLVDYSLCCSLRLRSQPRSGTCRLLSMLCSKIVPITEHVYVPNHTRGLVHRSLHRAWGLYRPPSTSTFSTVLEDSSITPFTVLGLTSITLEPQLGDCSSQLHMNWTHIQLRGNFIS